MHLSLGSWATGRSSSVLCALGCSFAMAMPVSTPPNAIAFATGEVKASSLFKLGGLISLLCGLVLLIRVPVGPALRHRLIQTDKRA